MVERRTCQSADVFARSRYSPDQPAGSGIYEFSVPITSKPEQRQGEGSLAIDDQQPGLEEAEGTIREEGLLCTRVQTAEWDGRHLPQ